MTEWRQVSNGGVDHAFGVPELPADQSPCGRTAPKQMELPEMPHRPPDARCKKCQFKLAGEKKPKKTAKAKGKAA
jgi:hypothetical protein